MIVGLTSEMVPVFGVCLEGRFLYIPTMRAQSRWGMVMLERYRFSGGRGCEFVGDLAALDILSPTGPF
jgi:hypothetical protein